MALVRTKRLFVSWLVGLFLVVQFAGIVPRLAVAKPDAATLALQLHHQNVHDHFDQNKPQHHHHDDQGTAAVDQCCALHLLTAVVPLVVTALPIEHLVQPVLVRSFTAVDGIGANLLFRPPRSSLSS